MKNVFKKSVIAYAILGSILSYANCISSSNKEGTGKPKKTLANIKVGHRLIIRSDMGAVVYKATIKESKDSYKEFDLTSLPNGKYYLELDKDFEIQITPFDVDNTRVIFEKDKVESIFKPIITTKDNVVFLNKLSLNLEPLEVKIYYNSGNNELIHSEKIKNKNNIQRVYRLLKNVNGRYKMVCKTQGRTFTTHFEF